ncbi:MAG: indole-3-glycerol phosphate synthase TrpC [Desulfobacterales bacterium]
MDILSRIVNTKKSEIADARRIRPLRELRDACLELPPARPFLEHLVHPGPSGINIVAEIKRRSPSKGWLNAGMDATRQAAAYSDGGAAALSVLTDRTYFAGSQRDLAQARSASPLPVLRKDFIIDAYQVFESRVMGADAVLLICRILSALQLRELLALSGELGMDALVEVHTPADAAAATAAGARLIGINNRNLASFETDIRTAANISARLAPNQIPVAASGIRTRADIEFNLAGGIFNFLIGEALVRSEDPQRLLIELQQPGEGAA